MSWARRIVVAVVAAAVIGGVAAWWATRTEENGVEAYRLYGNVDLREVELAFEVSGRIAELAVEEGERVNVGQRLAALEMDTFEHSLARVVARAEAQRQQLAALVAGTRPEEVRKARADTEAARVAAENARRTSRRLSDLARQQLASQEQVDDARAAADAAAARLGAAQEALALAEAGPRQEEIAAARATLASLEAELALARIQLDDATLLAPLDAVVRNRILEVGEMATPQRPVFTLAPDDPLWVRGYLPEPLLGQVRPGMHAQVASDSYPAKRYRGWVGYISPTAEFTPKAVQTEEVRSRLVYQMRVIVCNPEGELRLGMPVDIFIPRDQPVDEEVRSCGDS